VNETEKTNEKKSVTLRIVSGVAVLAIGLIVVLYPMIRSAYYDYNKNKILNQWGTYVMLNSPGREQIAKGLEISAPDPDPFVRPGFARVGEDGVIMENTQPVYDEGMMMADMKGIITISKIELRLPILDGDTPANLDIGACVLKGSPEMGQLGNYILAGHKSRIYGRHFSRLNELVIGNEIILSNGLESFKYKVTDKLQVTEDDVWVLNDTPDEATLTLVTCDYTQTPIGRLIIVAKLA
jgi:sortase A